MKLCEDVADDAGRPSMSSEKKKKEKLTIDLGFDDGCHIDRSIVGPNEEKSTATRK